MTPMRTPRYSPFVSARGTRPLRSEITATRLAGVAAWTLSLLVATSAVAVAQGGGDKGNLWGVRKERVSAPDRAPSRRHSFGVGVHRDSFLRYQVIGGEIEGERTLIVRGDGSLKLKEPDGSEKVGALTPGALRQFIQQFQEFEELEPFYGQKNDDPFQKTVTLVRRVAKRERKSSRGAVLERPSNNADTVTIYTDEALVLPRALRKMLDGLERMIETRVTEPRPSLALFSGFACGFMIDRPRYTVVLSEPPKIPEMWIQLSLANLADESVTVEFDSAQPYELVLERVETGETVWRWSEGKEFNGRGQRRALARDDLTWVESLELQDAAGVPFPAGRYVLRYEILAQPGFRGEAELSIDYEEPKAKKEDFRSFLADFKRAQASGAAAKSSGASASKGPGKSGGKGGGKGSSGGGAAKGKKKRGG